MSEEVDFDITEEDFEEIPSEYTSESAKPVVNRDVVVAPGAATGRRKEAVARVRLVPGTGQRPSRCAATRCCPCTQ